MSRGGFFTDKEREPGTVKLKKKTSESYSRPARAVPGPPVALLDPKCLGFPHLPQWDFLKKPQNGEIWERRG